MKLELRHIGSFNGMASKIIELSVTLGDAKLTTDVTNMDSFVFEEIIYNLRQVANELEEQNLKLKGLL